MSKIPAFLLVVAAAIHDPGGRLLLQQRPAGKRHGGLWEFPGGKVDPGETPRLCLRREIAEELGLMLDPLHLEQAAFAEEPGGEGHPAIVLLLYTARNWQGIPEGLEGQQLGWFTPEQAAALPLAPMDRQLLKSLG